MFDRKKQEPSSSGTFRLQCVKDILLLCVVALLLVVAVNIFTSQLPVRYTHLDTTGVQLYSISDHTKQIVSGLEDSVQLYLVAQYGKEDSIIQELLQRYGDLSGKIQVKQVDPVLQPDFLEQFSPSIETNSVIVASGDRFKIVSFSSMYVETQTYTETTGYVYDSFFAGEQEITGAISFVTSGELTKLYLLTGHGEAELPAYIQEAAARENIQVESLNLNTIGAVPADADLLLLYAPERDLLNGEAEMLLTYLKNGGSVMLIGGCLSSAPNLDTVVAYYGVERIEGTVIERNSNYYMEQYPSYVLANIANHSITQPLVNKGYFVLSPLSHGLVPKENSRDSIVSSPLLYTTDSSLSISDANPGDNAEALALGPFTIGLAVEEPVGEKTARLVWFTSPYLLLEDVNELSSGANYDLFLNALSWLYDFDEGISIRSKDLMMDYLSVRSTTSMALGAVMVLFIPAAVLAVGGIVLIRRRKR